MKALIHFAKSFTINQHFGIWGIPLNWKKSFFLQFSLKKAAGYFDTLLGQIWIRNEGVVPINE